MATAFDELAQKIPPGEMGGKDPQMVRDYLGRSSPAILSGQPSLPTVAAPTPAAGPSGPSGKGAVGEKPATGLLAAPGGAVGDISGTPATTGGDTSSEGPTSDAVGGQLGGLPSFSTQAGMFGLSGSPFGLTGTLGAPGGPQFGLTVGLGTISPSFSAGHVTGNPEVDQAITSAINMGGKEGLSLAGLPSQLSSSLLSALTSAPAAVGMIGGLISAMGAPFSLAALAHTIASMSPTSVFNIQNAVNNNTLAPFFSPEELAAVMAGPGRGPQVGGPQSATGLPSDAPALGPSGAGFGTGGSTGATVGAQGATLSAAIADMFSGGIFGGGPKANAFEDAPPAAPDVTTDTGPPGEASGTGAPGAGAASDSGDAGAPGDY